MGPSCFSCDYMEKRSHFSLNQGFRLLRNVGLAKPPGRTLRPVKSSKSSVWVKFGAGSTEKGRAASCTHGFHSIEIFLYLSFQEERQCASWGMKTGNGVSRETGTKTEEGGCEWRGGAGHFSIFVLLPLAALFFPSRASPTPKWTASMQPLLSSPHHRESAHHATLSFPSSIVLALLPESANSDTLRVRSSQLVHFCHSGQQILSFKKNQSYICMEFKKEAYSDKHIASPSPSSPVFSLPRATIPLAYLVMLVFTL